MAACEHRAATKEGKALLSNSGGHLADVLIRTFLGGLYAAPNINVMSPMQAVTVERALEEPEHALNHFTPLGGFLNLKKLNILEFSQEFS